MAKKKMKIIDLTFYGKYRMGLTEEEIKEYLKKRAGVKRLGNLYNKFCRVADANTMSGEFEYDRNGKRQLVSLMYRHDVQRFADLMFDRTPTYFD